METTEKLIHELRSVKERRNFYRRLAEALLYRHQISKEMPLAAVLRSQRERSQIDALTHWIFQQDKDRSLINLDLASAVLEMEVPLLRVLADYDPPG